ncbi:hypothetical protein KY316_03315 [Candidatus Woesearchaeota archaeon]|nr:hypothetical protein [Candidatus Woesearchaeota archaeon]
MEANQPGMTLEERANLHKKLLEQGWQHMGAVLAVKEKGIGYIWQPGKLTKNSILADKSDEEIIAEYKAKGYKEVKLEIAIIAGKLCEGMRDVYVKN